MTIDPLLVDVYEGDLAGHPDWDKLIAAGSPWHGAVIKATEGLHYAPPWFGYNWHALQQAAGARLGVDFFRGCYHYLRFADGAEAQAHFYVDFVERAGGGWLGGDLPPIVDVERANNDNCTKQDVVASVAAFVAEVKRLTNLPVIIYGGSLLADLGIADRLGCDALWIARYTPTLPVHIIERIGWDLPSTFGWQYCGDGESYLEQYPCSTPIGKTDISAVIAAGGGAAAIKWMQMPPNR